MVRALQPIKVIASGATYDTARRKSILTHLYEKSRPLYALMTSANKNTKCSSSFFKTTLLNNISLQKSTLYHKAVHFRQAKLSDYICSDWPIKK